VKASVVIQAMSVVQIQDLIAVLLVKPAVKETAVTLLTRPAVPGQGNALIFTRICAVVERFAANPAVTTPIAQNVSVEAVNRAFKMPATTKNWRGVQM